MNSCKAFWRPLDASIWRVHLTSIRQIWCAWLKSSCSALRNIKYRICNDMPDRLPFCFLRILFVSFAIRYLPFEENRGVMHAAARDQSWRNLLSGSLLSGIWTRAQRCSWFCCPDEERNSAFDLFGSLGFRIFEDFHAKMNFSGDFSTCEFIVSRMLWCT